MAQIDTSPTHRHTMEAINRTKLAIAASKEKHGRCRLAHAAAEQAMLEAQQAALEVAEETARLELVLLEQVSRWAHWSEYHALAVGTDLTKRVPDDVLELVLQNLTLAELFQAGRVSRRWRLLVGRVSQMWPVGKILKGVADWMLARIQAVRKLRHTKWGFANDPTTYEKREIPCEERVEWYRNYDEEQQWVSKTQFYHVTLSVKITQEITENAFSGYEYPQEVTYSIYRKTSFPKRYLKKSIIEDSYECPDRITGSSLSPQMTIEGNLVSWKLKCNRVVLVYSQISKDIFLLEIEQGRKESDEFLELPTLNLEGQFDLDGRTPIEAATLVVLQSLASAADVMIKSAPKYEQGTMDYTVSQKAVSSLKTLFF